MYKQLMTLLMVATLSCGLSFADDETISTKPVVEEQEEVLETTVTDCGCKKKKGDNTEVSCPCGKPGCGCSSIIVCPCGCNKKTEILAFSACDDCGCEHCDKDKDKKDNSEEEEVAAV